MASGADSTPRVFISYKRSDAAEFAARLREELVGIGIDAFLDVRDIAPGEAWQARLDALILRADIVLFVVSPGSIEGWDRKAPDESICAWEIRRTVELQKVLLPLIWEMPETGSLPPEIRKINWIDFERVRLAGLQNAVAFSEAFDRLKAALALQEILWVREHTKWIERASNWDAAGRLVGALLRFDDIAAVEAWARLKPVSTPEIPPVLSGFVAASKAKESEDREELLKRELRISETLQGLVATQALGASERKLHDSAMRVALAGEPSETELERGYPRSHRRLCALAAAATENRLFNKLEAGGQGTLIAIGFSGDGGLLHTLQGNELSVWDTATSACVRKTKLGDEAGWLRTGDFGPDALRVLTVSMNGDACIWSADTGDLLIAFPADPVEPKDDARVEKPAKSEVRGYEGIAPVMNSYSEALARMMSSFADEEAASDRVPDKNNLDWMTQLMGLAGRLNKDGDHAGGAAILSPDGGLAAVPGKERGVRIFSVADGRVVATLSACDAIAHCVAYSADGHLLAAALADNRVGVWRVDDGSLLEAVPAGTKKITGLLLDGSAGTIITGDIDGKLRLFDFKTREMLAEISAHRGPITAIAAAGDGLRIATGSLDETVAVWDIAAGRALDRHVCPGGKVMGVTFDRCGERIACHAESNATFVWDAVVSQPLIKLVGHTGRSTRSLFSDDGTLIVTSSEDGSVRLWDSQSGAEHRRFDFGEHVAHAVLSPANDLLAVTLRKGAVFLVPPFSTEAPRRFGPSDKHCTMTAFSPDGSRIVCASPTQPPKVWDVVTGDVVLDLEGHKYGVETVSFGLNGRVIVTASEDGVRMCRSDTGEEVFYHRAFNSRHVGAALSPDGRKLVAFSIGRSARLFNPLTGAEIARLEGHSQPMTAATFSPNSARVLTAAFDGNIRVWDAEVGAPVAIFSSAGLGGAFSPDSGEIVTWGTQVPEVWDSTWPSKLHGEQLVHAAAAELLRGMGTLTPAERRELHPLLGDIDADVVGRSLNASAAEEDEIAVAVGRWRARRRTAAKKMHQHFADRYPAFREHILKHRSGFIERLSKVESGRKSSGEDGASKSVVETEPRPSVRERDNPWWFGGLLLLLVGAGLGAALVIAANPDILR